MKNYDLRMILKERTFLGLRVAVCSFFLAGIGFLLFLIELPVLGMIIFAIALVLFGIGFIIHLNRIK